MRIKDFSTQIRPAIELAAMVLVLEAELEPRIARARHEVDGAEVLLSETGWERLVELARAVSAAEVR